jgi:hypothetical protein
MFLTNIHREARLVGLLGLIQHSGVNSSFLKRLKHKIGVYLPVFRIRILIGSEFNQVGGSGSGSRRAKVTHKNRNKFLDKNFFCQLYILNNFLSLKPWIRTNPDRVGIQPTRMLDPDPDPMNPDPKHCYEYFQYGFLAG